MPAAGLELRQLAPGPLTTRTASIGGAIERGVVHEERHAIGGELRVALEHAVAMLRAEPEGRQRVLRCELAGTAVRDPAWIRPCFHGCPWACSPDKARTSR